MACCNAVFERCAPDGSPVIGILDAETDTTTYRNLDGTLYAGDATLLVACETGAVSEATVTENDDGTTTVTHDPGDGSTPTSFTYGGDTGNITQVYVEGDTLTYDVTLPDGSTLTAGDPVPAGVTFTNIEDPSGGLVKESVTCCGAGGGATVTVVDDYTGTVDDGTTSDTFISQLDGLCDGAPIDTSASQFITKELLVSLGLGLTVPWRSDNGCSPATPPCTELNLSTLSPDGRQWEWPAGGPWELRHEQLTYEDSLQYNWAPNPAEFDPATAVVGDIIIPGSEQCITFTNPSACRAHTVTFYTNLTDIGIAGPNNPNGWDFEVVYEAATAIGGTWSTLQAQRNNTTDSNNVMSFGSEVSVQTVVPGGAQSYCVRARVKITTVGSGVIKLWSNHATAIGYRTGAL